MTTKATSEHFQLKNRNLLTLIIILKMGQDSTLFRLGFP